MGDNLRTLGKTSAETPRVPAVGTPVLFVLAWSSAYVVGDLGVRSTPPFTLLFLRFAVAAACMTVVAVVVRASWPRTRRELGHIAVAGVLVQGVQFLGVYGGFKLGVPAAISSLVMGVNPVLTALLARPVLGERITVRQRWGFALGVLGVVLAVLQGLRLSADALGGIGLTLLGLIAISGGTVYQKRFCPDMDLRSGQAIQLLAATVLAGLCVAAFETVHTDDPAVLAFSVGWLALVNSIGAVSLLYVMIRRGEAGRASTMFFLVPSATAVLAAITLHEPLSATALAGFVVAAAGVVLATYRSSSQ
ncbi:DMT family transporter [Amycolatopsis samaneae]|uniref:DMT family transporter n=1 Tax=Amycolatopsis samaneae TaxID=664691 RepID=A0ABW5GBG6_9PSEU